MQETYELCQEENGPLCPYLNEESESNVSTGLGVKARCIGILKGQLALQAPFADMFDSMQRAIQQVFQSAMADLREKIDDTFEQIAEDFALMIRDKKESESENRVREKIKAWLPSGLAEFESIKRDVEKIRARYPGEG